MKYWFLFECWYCPVCGTGEEHWTKGRIYDRPKPENRIDRLLL